VRGDRSGVAPIARLPLQALRLFSIVIHVGFVEGRAGRYVMTLFERIKVGGHEEVIFFSDEEAKLHAIIAIHSTALGPAVGGTRFYPYADEDEALADVMSLAKAMTNKAAAAGLHLGGGKAVIIGDPNRIKSEGLLRSYGRFVDTLNGRFITAEDVGTSLRDMDILREETRAVVGYSTEMGGSGDPSPVTAYGVVQGMRACFLEAFGSERIEGRSVAIQGVGKVGSALCEHLVDAGADVTVADVNPAAVARVVEKYGVSSCAVEDVHRLEVDVYSPCALGPVVTGETLTQLKCDIVAGAANNQLASPSLARDLRQRGILYAPDFLINAGGLINVEDELKTYDRARAFQRVETIFYVLREVFTTSRECGISTVEAAVSRAETRLRKGNKI
jgi:leucine dehydrogenase